MSTPSVIPVDLSGQNTAARLEVSTPAIRLVPAEFAKRHRIIPLEATASMLRIATASPGDARMIDDLRLLTGLEIEETTAPLNAILEKIAECYQVTVEQMIENLPSAAAGDGDSRNLHDIEVMANEPTVVNLVQPDDFEKPEPLLSSMIWTGGLSSVA